MHKVKQLLHWNWISSPLLLFQIPGKSTVYPWLWKLPLSIFYQIVCACYMWPWRARCYFDVDGIRYVLEVFYRTNGPESKTACLFRFVLFARWRHGCKVCRLLLHFVLQIRILVLSDISLHRVWHRNGRIKAEISFILTTRITIIYVTFPSMFWHQLSNFIVSFWSAN